MYAFWCSTFVRGRDEGQPISCIAGWESERARGRFSVRLERFAVLGDPEIEARYGVDSLPSLFIVDRQGRLVTSAVGATSEQQVVSFIEKLAEQ